MPPGPAISCDRRFYKLEIASQPYNQAGGCSRDPGAHLQDPVVRDSWLEESGHFDCTHAGPSGPFPHWVLASSSCLFSLILLPKLGPDSPRIG